MLALVTGCAGFIGAHLTKRLLDEGMEIYGIDALTDYYDPGIKRQNLKGLLAGRNFHFEGADINTADISPIVEKADYIFHLAAQPGVRASWGSSFDSYTRNNITATQRLLEFAKDSKNLKKFLYASSSSVYGETTVEKVSEDHPTCPFSPYGVTKLAAEHLCSLYARNFGLPVVSLRFFTVYGPGQRPDMAFSRLITAAYSGSPFTVFGNGSQERDFTYVDDVVEGLYRVATTMDATGVYNIGGGHVVSLNDVIALVEEIIGKGIALSFLPSEKGDVRRTSADISKISRATGYKPQVSLREGLLRQVKSFRGR